MEEKYKKGNRGKETWTKKSGTYAIEESEEKKVQQEKHHPESCLRANVASEKKTWDYIGGKKM